jgi:hypothetical protein
MSTKKGWIAALIILLLAGLNFYRYGGAGSSDGVSDQPVISMPVSVTIPTLNIQKQDQNKGAKTQRDLFAFDKPAASKPVFIPKPTIAKPTNAGPNPAEVAQEAARVHMLNVHIKGILSSQDDLSTIVNAPFFTGAARVGTNLGQGIVVEVIAADRVTIRHTEQGLLRDILVE